MKRYQPLLLQRLDIRLPGLHVRQLAMHQHLPETTAVRPHAHAFTQFLLYLSGQGRQEITGRAHRIQAGTAVFLPPGVEHAFRREANRRPICLVIDFDWRGSRKRPVRVAPMPLSAMREARQQIAAIAQLQRHGPTGLPLRMSTLILNLVEVLMAGLGLAPVQVAPLSSVARKVEHLLAAPEVSGQPLAEVARRAGYQRDYLNRLLKQQAGLTLGQIRSRTLVTRAQSLLRGTQAVTEISGALGFNDPNYFARWFRKQTGVTPSRWRRRA